VVFPGVNSCLVPRSPCGNRLLIYALSSLRPRARAATTTEVPPLNGTVAGDLRHTVEVVIVAGKDGESIVLHYHDEERIRGKQTELLREIRRPGNLRG
jgi:hypothetical protein